MLDQVLDEPGMSMIAMHLQCLSGKKQAQKPKLKAAVCRGVHGSLQ